MAPDPLGTLDAVMAGLNTLAAIAEEVGDEAVRNRITGAVTGLRAAVLTVRDEIVQQRERLEDLEAQARQAEAATPRRERPHRMKFGCYQFDDSEGLFCAACYDRQGGRRVRTIPRAGTTLVCPNCRSSYPMR